MRVLLLLNELNWARAPKVALDTFAALRDVAEVRTIACTGGPFKSVCAAFGPLSDLDLCLRGPIWRREYSRYRLVGALARERVRAHFTDRVQVPKIRHELEAVLRRGVS